MGGEPFCEARRLLHRQGLDNLDELPMLTELRVAVIHGIQDNLIQSVSLQAPRVNFHCVHVPH